MSKVTYQVVGSPFLHTTGGHTGYSVHGKVSKHINWSTFDGEAIFYIDDAISIAKYDTSNKKKYAWVLESKFIATSVVDYIKDNLSEVLETFEMIFTHNKELLLLDQKFKWIPASGIWVKDMMVHPKNKLISMISSDKTITQGHQERMHWVKKLSGKVDLYGRGFNPIINKEQGLNDYMFSIAIENGQYESYFTEKILDCFATGTIPVYLGSPDISDFFNPDGIIMLQDNLDLSPEIYYNSMDAVWDNFERAKVFEITEDYIYEKYLR